MAPNYLGLVITIDGNDLDRSEREALARRDGFESLREMARFWREENRLKAGVLWRGVVIHWDYDKPLYRNARGKVGARGRQWTS